MGDTAGQHTQAFQFLGLLHLSFQLQASFLGPLALADVGDRQQQQGMVIALRTSQGRGDDRSFHMCVKRRICTTRDQRFQVFADRVLEKCPIAREKHAAVVALQAIRKRGSQQLIPVAVHHSAERFVGLVNQSDIVQRQIADRRLVKQDGELIAGLLQLRHQAAQFFVLQFQFDLVDLQFVNQLADLLDGEIRYFRLLFRNAGFGFFPKLLHALLFVLRHVALLRWIVTGRPETSRCALGHSAPVTFLLSRLFARGDGARAFVNHNDAHRPVAGQTGGTPDQRALFRPCPTG